MKLLIAVAVVAAIVIGVTFLLLGIRSNDLERISESNCQAINGLIDQQNSQASAGKRAVMDLIRDANAADPTPPTKAEREATEKFINYYGG
jgi:hypothetical protein